MTSSRAAGAIALMLTVSGVAGAAGLSLPRVSQSAERPAPGELELLATLRDAAEKGEPDAQFKLGGAYYSGTPVLKRDFTEAAKWFRKAAEQGHVAAQYCLASQLAAGEGVKQDYVEAAKWFKQAAGVGDVASQFRIGELLNEGRGVEVDHAAAATWFRQAADHGNAGGQFSLGLLYSTGQGVKKNFVEAAKWYRLAALQGNWGAQINLALLYSTGVGGVARDYVLAYMWFDIAAASSTGKDQVEAQRARGDVAKAMTPAQIAEATAKSKTCRDSEFKSCG